MASVRTVSPRELRMSSVVLGVAALLVFGPLLRTPWLWDDKSLILESPVLKDRSQWAGALTKDFWALSANPREAGMYRPVVVASYFADRALFGTSPVGPHAVNLALHLLCAVLVGVLALRLGARPEIALGSTALFAFHPATVEAVANVSSRGDLLALAWVLLALLAARSDKPVLVFVTVVLAQLSKEAAFVAVPLLLLVEWAAQDFTWKLRVRSAVAALLATVVSLGVRRLALGASVRLSEGHEGWVFALTGAANVARYAALTVLPSLLVPYAPETQASWLALGLVVALLAAAVVAVRRAPWLTFGVAWFLVATAPIARWLPVTVRFSGLLLYLPLVGVALALARVPVRAAVWWLLPVACAVMSASVVPMWNDDVSLWSANVEAEPSLAQPRLNLANALAARNDPGSLEAYLAAIEVAQQRGDNKSRSMAELGVGTLLLLRAPEEAASHFAAARDASSGRLWQAGVNLAVAQFLAKRPVDAAMTLEAQWNVTPLKPVAEAGFKLGRELNDDAMMSRWRARLSP